MLNTINDIIDFIDFHPNQLNAFNYKDYLGTWQSISTQQFIHQVRCASAALKKIGLKKGDRVALIGPVSYEWSLCDFAIMTAGCVTVPQFHNISANNFVYEITQTEAKVIFVADPSCHLLCNDNKELFHKIISMDESHYRDTEMSFREFLSLGEQELAELNGRALKNENRPDDVATIIYTSGTTSLPKGVVLSHKNLLAQMIPSQDWFSLGQKPDDRYLSFLPLAHIFGRLMNIYSVFCRLPIYYLSDPLQLVQAAQEVHPTVLIMVPRIIDKIFKSVVHKINTTHGLKKKLASWAVTVGESENRGLGGKLKHFFADHILFSKLRNLLGGKVRLIICGSAKADPKLLKFFHTIGFPVIEGYGMTEGCPATTNRVSDMRFGTIGKPMPGVEVKIDDTGEILLRGDLVMQGYYKDEKLSATKIDKERWFHTGDKGALDADGYLTIHGRLSEFCKTAYGDFVDLPSIEGHLNKLPYVDMSVLIAQNKPYATSLFFPNIEAIEHAKQQKHLEHLSTEEFLKQDFVKREMEHALEKVNICLNNWERIRDYRFVPAKATIEGGELSPTLKHRRSFIEDKYKQLVDEMYPDHLIAINF